MPRKGNEADLPCVKQAVCMQGRVTYSLHQGGLQGLPTCGDSMQTMVREKVVRQEQESDMIRLTLSRYLRVFLKQYGPCALTESTPLPPVAEAATGIDPFSTAFPSSTKNVTASFGTL